MQSTIEQQVMASVGVLYTARMLVGAVALKLYALVLAAVALWQFTWVHRVFENWAQVGLGGTAEFLAYAILHTHLPVQLALAVATVMALWLAADAIRTLLHPPRSLLRLQ